MYTFFVELVTEARCASPLSVRYSAIEMTPVARLVRDWQCKCSHTRMELEVSYSEVYIFCRACH